MAWEIVCVYSECPRRLPFRQTASSAQLKRGPPDPERPASDVSPGPGGSACPDPPSQGARNCVDTLEAGATLQATVLGRATTIDKYPFTSCTEPCSTLPITQVSNKSIS